MDLRRWNRKAWDRQVDRRNRWTVPVGPAVIRAARQGDWEVVLTPVKPVPRDWFPDLDGCRTLCLASAGGQQAPVFAAAGAIVTSLDNSPRQLAQDRLVAERDALELETIEGDMANLSAFADETFDLIFHPCANSFVSAVRPVWGEAYRTLRQGGRLLAGFANPVLYVFDEASADRGVLTVRHSLPYSDLNSLPESELQRKIDKGEPLEFGHTLEDQIGGQCAAGLSIVAMYEDYWPESVLSKHMPTFIATQAVKR